MCFDSPKHYKISTFWITVLNLSSNPKWADHIQDVYARACKRINIIRHLKNKIDRQSLEKLYIGFIRPILEYGNIIWDNCSKEQSDLIESIQQDAARIVTGLRKGTPKWKLYNELGWDSLRNRRWKNKLLFFHKVISGNIPDYIAADVLSYTNHNTEYNLRN
jgi:hypothetical protein